MTIVWYNNSFCFVCVVGSCFYILTPVTPFSCPQAIFMIPTKPPPTLKDPGKFSSEFSDFISRCLIKNPEERQSATALLQHKYIKSAKNVSVLKELITTASKILEDDDGSGSVSGGGGGTLD